MSGALCNRCAMLFDECRPLAGQPCGRGDTDLKALAAAVPNDVRQDLCAALDALPRIPAQRVHAAALVFSNRTGDLHLVPVLAFDFYPKERACASK